VKKKKDWSCFSKFTNWFCLNYWCCFSCISNKSPYEKITINIEYIGIVFSDTYFLLFPVSFLTILM